MTEVSCQQRQAALDVCVLGVPALQCGCDEAMAQVVQTGWAAPLIEHAGGETQMIPDPR